MSNKSTVEYMNIMVAIFDGWKLAKGDLAHECLSCDKGIHPSGWCTCDQKTDRFKKSDKIVAHTYFQYHSSWEWLMPVVLKAKALYLNYDTGQMRDQLKMRYKAIENELCNLSLINTHYCLFQFIQWYNNQSTNNNDTTTGND